MLLMFFACVAEAPTIPFDTAAMVAAHNAVRAEYGVAGLAWEEELATVAADWSRELASGGCELVHSGGEYGENLYWTSASAEPDEVVASWAAEVADYDLEAFACAPEPAVCGHFTQVVWADTTRVGCAAVSCGEAGGEVWTCEYDPPGNWVGEAPF